MKKNLTLLRALTVLIILTITAGRADQPRERLLLDAGWRFQLGDPADLANASETNVAYYPEIPNLEKLTTGEMTGSTSETNLARLRPDPVATHMGENVSTVQTNYNDSAWQSVNVPHDWVVALPFDSTADMGHGYKLSITGSTSSTSVGWYRHTFNLPATYTNKTMWLEFDGVYRNCLVWLNGHILGRHVSGYTGFSFDVSQYANPGGTNVLVVRVDASRFEGWFYEGAGIYRHVWLVKTDPVHVAHWGTYVTNLISGSNALVAIQTQLNNDSPAPAACNLTSTLLDPDGNIVTSVTQGVTIAASTNQVASQTVTVTNARLWSLNSPQLYRWISTVTQGTATNDVYGTTFGIRTFKWDPNNGLLLNGQRVELQGMCNHQDHAGVGIAVPDRVNYYRVERLKEMGCNTWRTSHNSPTPELLDACDELGMLVLDENRRVGVDPETLGEVQSHVLRDRNRPSVFAWSLGNEETYIQGTTAGAAVVQTMQNLAHQLDPTRSCTIAQNGSWGSGFTTVIDVMGYNYLSHGSEDAIHANFPNLPSFSSEEGSTEAARGIYAGTSTYDANYDNAPTHTYTIEQLWQYYLARSWLGGFCIWTGFDYRGEPTPFSWPNINSQYGPVDTCGFTKDIYYYYQANWTGKPILHILPHWNWTTPGQIINVWVYSSCDLVEMFLNGVSQGRQLNNPLAHLEWNLPYAAGALQAVGYVNGQPVVTNTVTTTGAASAINLQPDRTTILADGRDVSVVTVAVVDSQGRVVPTATNAVNFTVTGGTIVGLGNGDPICHQSDQATNNAGYRSVFNGLAQVIVQSTNQGGTLTLTATPANLGTLSSASAVITLTTNLLPPDAPSAPMATASSGQVWLSWDIVPAATGYNVARSTVSGGPYSLVLTNTGGLTWTDTSVINGTTYYYVLTAVNTNGASSNSPEAMATPHIVPPLFITQPASFTNTHLIYAGSSIPFSALCYGTQPIVYQWYEVVGGVTNAIAGATNGTYLYQTQTGPTNSIIQLFVMAGNGASNLASSAASLVNAPSVPDIVKANTTTLNGSGDWIPATTPDNTRIGRFDNTVSAGDEGMLTLGGDLVLGDLQFINNLNGPVNVGGANTLTLDSSQFPGWPGIDMSAANQNVNFSCGLTLKGGQAWNVINGQTLTIAGLLTTTGAGVDFSSFAGTLGILGNVNGILGPWATIGSGTSLNYAMAGNGTVTNYTGGTAATANNMTSSTANYVLGGALTLSANSTGNTLQYTGNTQTLDVGANTLTLMGLMNSGSGNFTLTSTTGTGALVIGANQELVVANNARNLSLACSITNNPAGNSLLTYNGVGGGTLVLNPNAGSSTADNASTFTGDFIINSGTVSVQKSVNISSAGPAVSSALGNRSISRNVVVNSGATLSFDIGNELGRGAGDSGSGNQVFPLMTFVLNKGGVIRSTTSNRTLGPVLFNGGTLAIGNAGTTSYEPFGFSSDVVVTGTSPSAITAVAGGAVNLTANAAANSQRNFTVADVTGDAGVDFTVSAVLANSTGNGNAAGLIKSGAGTMSVAAANIYTGPTTVNGGRLLVDGTAGPGSVTVNSGGTLGGRGTLSAPVTIQAGGTIQAGDGNGDTGTLSINNSLSLGGNTVVILNRNSSQNASQIAGVTTLNRGGTLTITNAGSPLAPGDAFKLFSASAYTGSFSATNFPALAAGLSWSNSISGTAYIVTVTGQITTPSLTGVRWAAGNLVLNGAQGAPGQQYRVVMSTNLATSFTNWAAVATNTFGGDGGYTNTVPLSASQPAAFFRIVTP